MRARRSRAEVPLRCRTGALLAAVLVALCGGGLLDPAMAAAQEPAYTVATDTTFAPFEFQDKSGNFVGIDMDLIRAIADDQKFAVDIKPLGFDAALQAVQDNHFDRPKHPRLQDFLSKVL